MTERVIDRANPAVGGGPAPHVGPGSDLGRLVLPRPPEKAPPYRVPVIASLAPLVLALALWVMTGSPFALLFAVLGPVTAGATWVDSRMTARRLARRESSRFSSELAAAGEAVDAAHREERAAAAEACPSAASITSRRGADPYRWGATDTRPILVDVGSGRVRSTLQVDAGPSEPAGGTADDATGRLAELRGRATWIEDAPVSVDARLGIGVAGPAVVVAAAARAICVVIAWGLSPARYWIAAPAADWADALPHRRPREVRTGYLLEAGCVGEDEPVVVVASAPSVAALPGACRIVIGIDGGVARIARHPDRSERREIHPSLISREAAAGWARRAAADAEREGLIPQHSRLPPSVSLGPLLGPVPGSLPGGGTFDSSPLACRIAVASAGPVAIDLVRDGPHAVIGGTTGSGKSELLVSWVLGMAASAPPTAVTFLLVDFKGGSAFAPLAALPHTVGILTDLDPAGAARALASLRAELRFREAALADAGAKDVAAVDGLPRLVIIVDEFAAVLADHPDLHSVFVDIAARGRSLGVHLVLCTQRPSGVVRDAVMGNADLRISLRVNNRADSTAVVESDDAASIAVGATGRGVLSAGGRTELVQFALATADDVRDVAERWQGLPPPRRPWCEPLAGSITAADLPAPPTPFGPTAVPFGLLDLPDEQRTAVALWDPVVDGHLLVLGGPRSGKSTALATLAAGADRIPAEVPAAWDRIVRLDVDASGRTVSDSTGAPRVIAIDDIDSLLARFPAEHRDAVIDRLARVLRDGAHRGIHLVLAAQRLTSDIQSLASLMPARLLLRHPGKQEFLMAGGETAHYHPDLPPGGGVWQGARVQVVVAESPRPSPSPAAVADVPREAPVAIVTSRLASLGRELRDAGYDVRDLGEAGDLSSREIPIAVIGDVEDWQSRWGALATLRPVATILFDGCSTAEFRVIARSRELPPPIAGMTGVMWRLREDGGADRARLAPVP